MTGRLTLKLALAVATGGIVGGLKTGNSVFINVCTHLLPTIEIFDTESGMFEPGLLSNTHNGVLFFNETHHVDEVVNGPLLVTQNGDDSEKKAPVGECHPRNNTRMVDDGDHTFVLWQRTTSRSLEIRLDGRLSHSLWTFIYMIFYIDFGST